MLSFVQFYVAAVMMDAILSIVATIWPSFEMTSGVLSNIVTMLSVAVILLAARNKIQPKKILIVLPSFYLAMIVFQLVVISMLIARYGTAAEKMEISMEFLCKEFAWFATANWIMLVAWLGIGIYGIVGLIKAKPENTQV